MSNPESSLNNTILDTERAARLIYDLEIAQLKQSNPLVSDQELRWRLALLPEQTTEGLAQLKESVEFALREELRQVKRLAGNEVPVLVSKLAYDLVAQLMIYGRSKSN